MFSKSKSRLLKRIQVKKINLGLFSVLFSSRLFQHNHVRVQFSHSVVSDSLQPMDCSTPGFPVHHQLLELAQTHVHQGGDAIQPSCLLSSSSPADFNLSQHQGLLQ